METQTRAKKIGVTCDNCGQIATLNKTLVERPVPDHDGVVEKGISCAECDHWHHSYFMTPATARKFKTLQTLSDSYKKNPNIHTARPLRRAQKSYKRYFDKVNKGLREKLGVESAAETSKRLTAEQESQAQDNPA